MRRIFALVVSLLIALLGNPSVGYAQTNLVPGTCSAFKDYINGHGVTDATHVPHEGRCAYWAARPKFAVTLSNPGPPKTQLNGRVCYSAMAHVDVTLHPDSDVLTWDPRPPAANPTACTEAINDWKSKALAHETHHSHAYFDAAKQINETFNKHLTTWCTFQKRPRPQVVTAGLKTQAEEDALDSVESMLKAANKEIDTEECDPSSLCAVCAPPPCPLGQLLIEGECHKTGCNQSGPFAPCGFDAGGQQLQCCPWSGNTSVCANKKNVCPIPPK